MFTTPLVGMVVLVSVFLGIGPAHAAIAAAWIALLLYEEPRWEFAIDENAVARRWAVSLVVALGLVWIGWSLQRLRRKEAERAIEAERESATAKDFQELATSLSAAATPSEVARSLVTLHAGPARCDRGLARADRGRRDRDRGPWRRSTRGVATGPAPAAHARARRSPRPLVPASRRTPTLRGSSGACSPKEPSSSRMRPRRWPCRCAPPVVSWERWASRSRSRTSSTTT